MGVHHCRFADCGVGRGDFNLICITFVSDSFHECIVSDTCLILFSADHKRSQQLRGESQISCIGSTSMDEAGKYLVC